MPSAMPAYTAAEIAAQVERDLNRIRQWIAEGKV